MIDNMKIITSYILFFYFSIFHIYAQEPIERVEPPNWWVGMEYNSIELLVYGKDIASYKVTLDGYEGVSLENVKTVENSNYLFISLNISEEALAGELLLKFNKTGSGSFTYSYPIEDRVVNRSKIEGFNSSDAIYLITPDRFANGDVQNDEVEGLQERLDRNDKGGRHGGDVAGIVDNLDYIKKLGFTAIWTNPILENNMPSYSYHGYATTDFYKVDPRYGSNASFKEMCDKASEIGMKVIMDMIANHAGLDHWWIKDLPSKDWINQWDTYTQTNHKKTVILDPYATKKDKKIFFDGWFVPTMPDLNQRNESMAKYLIQNTIWWIEYSGISGIRMDTYPYPDMYFMNDWTKAVMQEYPNFNIVGEEWVLRPTIVSYWQKGKQNANGYTSELKSVMDFPLQNALVNSLTDPDSWNAVYEELGQDYLYPDPQNLVVFPDNHDMSRIFTQLNEDKELLKLALAYITTIRGIPQIYYGTEVLMKNRGTEDHGVIRSDFPGGWPNDKVNSFTGKGLNKSQLEIKNYVTKLFNWRKNNKAVHEGGLVHFASANNLYVFFRFIENEKIMVILNKDDDSMTLNVKDYEEVLEGNLSGKDIITDKHYEDVESIRISGKTALIIELE